MYAEWEVCVGGGRIFGRGSQKRGLTPEHPLVTGLHCCVSLDGVSF